MKKLNKKGQAKGFTLTELVIVIVIIAILAAVLIPSMTGYVERARKSSNEQTAESMGTVFAAWLIDESDVYSYAANDNKPTMSAKACVKYNAALTGAKKEGDILDAAKAGDNSASLTITTDYTEVYYAANDLIVDTTDNSATKGYYIAKPSETSQTVISKGDLLDTTKIKNTSDTTLVTKKYKLTSTGAEDYNAKLTGAKSTTACSFNAYYLEASENNTEAAKGIQNVVADGTTFSFEYKGSKYTTKAVYSNGAFTYETTKNA